MELNYVNVLISNRIHDDPDDSKQTPPEKPNNYPDFDGTLGDKTPTVNT